MYNDNVSVSAIMQDLNMNTSVDNLAIPHVAKLP